MFDVCESRLNSKYTAEQSVSYKRKIFWKPWDNFNLLPEKSFWAVPNFGGSMYTVDEAGEATESCDICISGLL
jgi:hypothetical protein